MRALACHKCGPGSNPGVDAISGLSLLLVLFFAPRSSSPGTPVFPSPQNPTLPNSNSTRNQVDEEPLCGCATSKSLFIDIYYLFTYILQRTVCKRGSPPPFYQLQQVSVPSSDQQPNGHQLYQLVKKKEDFS